MEKRSRALDPDRGRASVLPVHVAVEDGPDDQSTNEELEATNEELRNRVAEVAEIDERHREVMSSLPSAVVVLDREILVEHWNRAAEELFGLREAEVRGKALGMLEIGLPTDSVIPHGPSMPHRRK